MHRVAILGAGISGLAAGFYLEQARAAGQAIEYKIFEGAARAGGVLRSENHRGFISEHGAEAFLTEKPAASELCRELGLGRELVGSNDAARKTYILAHGRLVALPEGILFVAPLGESAANWELFSETTRRQIAQEKQLRPASERNSAAGPGGARLRDGRQAAPQGGDESAAGFIRRHFGDEAVRWLAQPMLAGIYGGDAERLSARATLPKLVEMERAHGSLVAAYAARRPQGAARPPLFTTLRGGMQQLIVALVERIGAGRLALNCRAVSAEYSEGRWSVKFADGQAQCFDSLVVALPAFAAAELLRGTSPQAAEELAAIEYSSSAVVALAYESAAQFPEGFGFLAPPSENRRTLAGTFVHQKFPGRAPTGKGLLRIFFGGVHDASVLALSDAELANLAQQEAGEILKLGCEPIFSQVARWPRSMPQYTVGHVERVLRVERMAAEVPGLALIGSAYHGVGIPDCIALARKAADAALDFGRSRQVSGAERA